MTRRLHHRKKYKHYTGGSNYSRRQRQNNQQQQQYPRQRQRQQQYNYSKRQFHYRAMDEERRRRLTQRNNGRHHLYQDGGDSWGLFKDKDDGTPSLWSQIFGSKKAAAPPAATPAEPPAEKKSMLGTVGNALSSTYSKLKDNGMSGKFLFTRLLNPGNVDRFIFKNAFFIEFIDFETIKRNYERSDPIAKMAQWGYQYIYTQKYLGQRNTAIMDRKASNFVGGRRKSRRFGMQNNNMMQRKRYTRRFYGGADEDASAADPASKQQVLEAKLLEKTGLTSEDLCTIIQGKCNGAGSLPPPGGEVVPYVGAPPPLTLEDGTEIKDASKAEDAQAAKIPEEHVTAMQQLSIAFLKSKPLIGAAATAISRVSSAASGFLANNFAAKYVRDTANRYNFSRLNDSALVERAQNENPNGPYAGRNYLHFRKEFDPLFRFFYIYKYQTSRMLWTTSESAAVLVGSGRLTYMIKSLFTAAANNPLIRGYLKEEVNFGEQLGKMFKDAILATYRATHKLVTGQASKGQDAEEEKQRGVRIYEEDLRRNGLKPVCQQSSVTLEQQAQAGEDSAALDADVNGDGQAAQAGQTGGYLGETIVNFGKGMVNKWYYGRIFSKLYKSYDFDSPVPDINKAKYTFVQKKFPSFMDDEVKFALYVAIHILILNDNTNINDTNKLKDSSDQKPALYNLDKIDDFFRKDPSNDFVTSSTRKTFSIKDFEILIPSKELFDHVLVNNKKILPNSDPTDSLAANNKNGAIRTAKQSYTKVTSNDLYLSDFKRKLEENGLQNYTSLDLVKFLYSHFKTHSKVGFFYGGGKTQRNGGAYNRQYRRTRKLQQNQDGGIRFAGINYDISKKLGLKKPDENGNAKGELTTKKYFYRALDVIFQKTFENMTDRYVQGVMDLANSNQIIRDENCYQEIGDTTVILEKDVLESVVKFISIIHEKTTMMPGFFANTLLYNALNVQFQFVKLLGMGVPVIQTPHMVMAARIAMSMQINKSRILFGGVFNDKTTDENEEHDAKAKHIIDLSKVSGANVNASSDSEASSKLNTIDYIPVYNDNGQYKFSPIVDFAEFTSNYAKYKAGSPEPKYHDRQIIQIYKRNTSVTGRETDYQKLPYVGRIIEPYNSAAGSFKVIYSHLFPGNNHKFTYNEMKHRMRTTYVKSLKDDNFKFQVLYPYDFSQMKYIPETEYTNNSGKPIFIDNVFQGLCKSISNNANLTIISFDCIEDTGATTPKNAQYSRDEMVPPCDKLKSGENGANDKKAKHSIETVEMEMNLYQYSIEETEEAVPVATAEEIQPDTTTPSLKSLATAAAAATKFQKNVGSSTATQNNQDLSHVVNLGAKIISKLQPPSANEPNNATGPEASIREDVNNTLKASTKLLSSLRVPNNFAATEPPTSDVVATTTTEDLRAKELKDAEEKAKTQLEQCDQLGSEINENVLDNDCDTNFSKLKKNYFKYVNKCHPDKNPAKIKASEDSVDYNHLFTKHFQDIGDVYDQLKEKCAPPDNDHVYADNPDGPK